MGVERRPSECGSGRKPGERGAALLTVLLLVAVISVLAASALEKLRLSTRLAQNGAAIEQARALAYAAETVATIRVNAILDRDAARTTLAGGWAGHPFALPVPGGIATLTVRDGGNCFNLNGLVAETGPGAYAAQRNGIVQFVRLMKLIGIPGQTAEGIAAAAADWIDTDTDALPMGAEDAAYLGKETPYRTANTLMTDVSELRAVAGMTPELYAKLAPWVCALPVAQPSKINVNTLQPEQAPLFAMLFPDTMDVGKARALLLQRPAEGYDSTYDFLNLSTLQGGLVSADAQNQTDVRTYWFAMKIDVTANGVHLTQTDLLDASGQRAQIVSRQWSDPA
ncbi:MAG TPA: type II secretion system minor pseudopilin GspK [Sphingomonas sp.]|nr:type II secretion system minor pseudopilin GspK [Sphingomonas sp.]